MLGIPSSALTLAAILAAPQLPPPTPLPPRVERPRALAVTNAHIHPLSSAPIEGGTMDADLVIWDGDPVGTWGEPVVVIVDGRVVYRRRAPEAGPTSGGASRDADAGRESAEMRR